MEPTQLEFKKEPWYKNFTVFIFSGFLFFAIEYLIKNLVVIYLQSRSLDLGIFSLNFVPNYQMAFSIPVHRVILTLAGMGILMALIRYLIVCCRDGLYDQMWAINFVIWGAFSNLYDRLTRGFVVDYINIGFWPVFNLSDLVIVGGLVAVLIMIAEREKRLSMRVVEA